MADKFIVNKGSLELCTMGTMFVEIILEVLFTPVHYEPGHMNTPVRLFSILSEVDNVFFLD